MEPRGPKGDGQARGEGLDLRVEFLVLALEEYRDLTEHVSIADGIEAKHTRTTSSRGARGKIFSHFFDDERRRRERDAPDQRAALLSSS